MKQIQLLYAIEKRCREQAFSFDEVKAVRKAEALSVFHSLGEWIIEQYAKVLPKSAIREALGYSIERWQRMSEYVNDGQLNIDNNPVEKAFALWH